MRSDRNVDPHGGNAISRAILGSVTKKVIQASNVPVLAVAPEGVQAETALRTMVVPLDEATFPGLQASTAGNYPASRTCTGTGGTTIESGTTTGGR